MDWVDKQEEKRKEEHSKEYFNIKEGDQKFQLLSHCAPFAQRYANGKYFFADMDEEGVSIKGMCWVLQDGDIKSAKLPYTVVKAIRALQNNDEWDFQLPFEHVLTLNAKKAGTKEVEYNLTPSPKKLPFSASLLEELSQKPTPEEMIEKMRAKSGKTAPKAAEYPVDDINPDNIPF